MSRSPVFWKLLAFWVLLGAPILLYGVLTIASSPIEVGELLGEQLMMVAEALSWIAVVLWVFGTPIVLAVMELKFRRRRLERDGINYAQD